jgi:hypothetical protein
MKRTLILFTAICAMVILGACAAEEKIDVDKPATPEANVASERRKFKQRGAESSRAYLLISRSEPLCSGSFLFSGIAKEKN